MNLHKEIETALEGPDPAEAVLEIARRRGLRWNRGWIETVWRPLWLGLVERAQGNQAWLAREVAGHMQAFAQAA